MIFKIYDEQITRCILITDYYEYSSLSKACDFPLFMKIGTLKKKLNYIKHISNYYICFFFKSVGQKIGYEIDRFLLKDTDGKPYGELDGLVFSNLVSGANKFEKIVFLIAVRK